MNKFKAKIEKWKMLLANLYYKISAKTLIFIDINLNVWVQTNTYLLQQAGKPMFISGGVLEDLVVNAELNDSEVTDIANALLDGVTGFILTKCHNVDFTILAIHKLNELCRAIEPLSFNMSDIRLMRDDVSKK